MGSAIAALGEQMLGSAATQASGGLMGMLFQGGQDRRQIRQQEKLQNLQIRGQKEMTDYEFMKQLQMWKDTNYSAQMGEIEKAGLNAGLLYGMGGQGGMTTGKGGGTVTGGHAPSGGGEAIAMAGQAGNMALMNAQRENIEASTAKINAEKEKLSGVDTQKAQTEILDLTQGIENKKAQETLTKVQTRLGEIQQEITGRTIEDSVRYIGWAAEKTMQEMTDWRYKNNINEETWRSKVEQVKADLVGTWLRNALTKAQTGKTQAETEAIITGVIQGWKSLEIQGWNAQTQDSRQKQDAWLNDVQKSTQIPMDILREALDGILRPGTKITNNKQTNTEINY